MRGAATLQARGLRPTLLVVGLLTCLAALLLSAPGLARGAVGDLTPVQCFEQESIGETVCEQVPALTEPTGLDITGGAAGASIYVTDYVESAILEFRRQPSGEFSFVECVAEAMGDCRGVTLQGAFLIDSSPDGSSVYVTGEEADQLTTFDRSPLGSLDFLACVGRAVAGCSSQPNFISETYDVHVSHDGGTVFTAAEDGVSGIDVLDRAPSGVLTPRQCIRPLVDAEPGCDSAPAQLFTETAFVETTDDGSSVYVSTNGYNVNEEIYQLREKVGDPGQLEIAGCVSVKGDRCPRADPLFDYSATDLDAAPDGRSVYVAAPEVDALLSFQRDLTTGELSFDGCFQNAATHAIADIGCTPTGGLDQPLFVAVSPDGRSVYTHGPGALNSFTREPSSGALTPNECLEPADAIVDTACADTTSLREGHGDLDISDDGKTVAVASRSDAPAIAIFSRESAAVPDPDPDTEVTDLDVTAKKKQKQKGKKIKVKLTAGAAEEISAKASGKIKIKGSKGAFKLKPQTKSIGAGKASVLKLKLKSKKDAKKVGKAIKRYKKASRKRKKKIAIKAPVKVKATDLAGNSAVEKRVVNLR